MGPFHFISAKMALLSENLERYGRIKRSYTNQHHFKNGLTMLLGEQMNEYRKTRAQQRIYTPQSHTSLIKTFSLPHLDIHPNTPGFSLSSDFKMKIINYLADPDFFKYHYQIFLDSDCVLTDHSMNWNYQQSEGRIFLQD